MLKKAESIPVTCHKATISVAQNPQIARMTGILETNTLRLLDPPLVVELSIAGAYTKHQLLVLAKTFVCKLNLFEVE
jgi:hypothetical protein